MNKARMVPFRAEHLDLIDMRPVDAETMGEDYRERLMALAIAGTGVCILYEGRILGVIGFLELWSGTLQAFIVPSQYVPQYPIIFARLVKRYLKSLEASHQPHRIQSEAIADDLHDGWMKFLGFEQEGTMRQYSTNRVDFRMWARVYEVAE